MKVFGRKGRKRSSRRRLLRKEVGRNEFERRHISYFKYLNVFVCLLHLVYTHGAKFKSITECTVKS